MKRLVEVVYLRGLAGGITVVSSMNMASEPLRRV